MCACCNLNESWPVHKGTCGSGQINVVVRCFMRDIALKSVVHETLVEDINLYIVNSAGDMVYHGYYEDLSGVVARTYKDMECTLYVVANAGRELIAKSESELHNMVYPISSFDDMVSENGGVLMTGKTQVLLSSDGDVVNVELERCISKIVLSCNFDGLDKDICINVKSVGLKNVPNAIYPFKESRIEEASASIDGAVVTSPSVQVLNEGIVFYQYENMQGVLLPDNGDQKLKVWPEEDIYSKICSYIEIVADYLSPRKRGEIIYRFYLGRDMTSNFDVIRNTQHNILVSFEGEGSVDETTWRVDNGAIMDLVTSLTVTPMEHTFDKWGSTLQLQTEILPVTANDKSLVWQSSDEKVAVVDAFGRVTSVGDGSCRITATTCDGSNIVAGCDIDVDAKIEVTSIAISKKDIELCNGMECRLKATIYPSDATFKGVIWKSSNENMVTIDTTGMAIGGKELGNCYIYAISADNNNIVDSCRVTSRKKERVSIRGERTIYMKVGESYQLTWWSDPEDAKVTFKSSNSPCVTVDEYGVLRGIRPTRTVIHMFVFGSYDIYYVEVEEAE